MPGAFGLEGCLRELLWQDLVTETVFRPLAGFFHVLRTLIALNATILSWTVAHTRP